MVAADLDGKRDNARIRIGAALDVSEVINSLADQIERRETLVWDKQRDDLVQRSETRLGGMLLDEQVRAAQPDEATTAALVERVRATRLAALRWPERAMLLRARVAFLRLHGGRDEWPDWSDAALLATLDDWLAPYLVGAVGAADLARLDTEMLLSSQLGWDGSTRLGQLAPAHLDTPAGRTAVIDYSRDIPTASVRVQDLFGLRQHPTVAGDVRVSLELLSPADRPIQITSDLPGFWAGSWAEVRKEMAGRYPKHQWPADPANATPTRLK